MTLFHLILSLKIIQIADNYLLERIKTAPHLSLSPFWILNTGKRGFPDSSVYCSLDSNGGSSGISAKTSVSGKQPCEEIKEC